MNDVTPDQFRKHIELAIECGYRFVHPDKIASGLGQEGELAITFDDGLKSVLRNAAPILAEHRIPWSLFVVTDWVEGRHSFEEGLLLNWHEIERLMNAGATIGSHSSSHPNFEKLSAGEAGEQLFESAKIIEARLGGRPRSFAIPFGQSRDWSPAAAAAAREAGYEIVYAQSVHHRPPTTVPRTFITRFDNAHIFSAALRGTFDRWEEWV